MYIHAPHDLISHLPQVIQFLLLNDTNKNRQNYKSSDGLLKLMTYKTFNHIFYNLMLL